MRQIWRFLSFLFLAVCFAILIFDFANFVLSGGQGGYLTLAEMVPGFVSSQIERWAVLEGSTWGNVNRLVLGPFINLLPLWSISLIFAVLFWALRRRTT